jgi:hypothetical protein
MKVKKDMDNKKIIIIQILTEAKTETIGIQVKKDIDLTRIIIINKEEYTGVSPVMNQEEDKDVNHSEINSEEMALDTTDTIVHFTAIELEDFQDIFM